ncbi:MAG: TfoX/Sxy family protein [Bryobacteraceae bacterium]|nr:TfoX/Sxy family protein [Bryobacteraceae bacterium]
MAKPNPYLEYLLEHFAPLGQIHSRAMFGGHCLYCNGITFALVAGQAVYLKADDVNRPQFEARGLAPFRPFPDSDMVMKYYEAPAEMFESLEGLREWAGAAVAAGERAKQPKRKAVS